MNKQFMYVNGTIVISDESGMKPAIPYVDNIEDVLVLENEIEYLEMCLAEDQEKLESKKNERTYRTKDSKKISILGSVMAVGAAFGVGQLAGISHDEVTNTIMGPMSEYLAYSIPMSVGCIGFVQMISLLGLSYRPSIKDINGIEERIKYEKSMIDIFKEELEYLNGHSTCNKKDQVEEMVSYDVHYKFSLDYLREALKLRYAFGYDPKRMITMFKKGELEVALKEEGFSDDVIMDFTGFVSNYLESLNIDKRMEKK